MLSLFFERLLKTDRLFGVEEAKAYDSGACLNIMFFVVLVSIGCHFLNHKWSCFEYCDFRLFRLR